MKKSLLSIFAMATMLLATGCSQEDELVNSNNDYVDASITIDLSEGAQSRTLGLGAKVNQLYYGIYDQAGNVVPVITNVDNTNGNFNAVNVGEADITGGTATVKMRLVKGQTYDFVFWAQVKDNAHYTINKDDLKLITVNYGGDANDETRDAFFACEPDYKVESHFTKTVYLKRPFAQVNVATTKADFEAAKILLGESPITKSKMVVKNVPTTLNLLDGKVSNPTEATFLMAPLPKETPEVASDYDILEVQDVEYAHLAMNYVLSAVKGEQEVVETEIEFANTSGSINTIKVSQLPIHRNYRTNIIGNILTTNGEFEVIVDAEFDGDEIRELWDGETTVAVTPIDENGKQVYLIATAEELAWVAEQVNSGANTFKGAIVRLTDNIYLNNQPWTPIGGITISGYDKNGKPIYYKFEGTFEGAGKTIYGLNIVAQPASRTLTEGDSLPAGLFGQLAGSIKDFIVEDANISHITGGGNGIGVAVGSISAGASVENVSVRNAVLNGNRMMGGIAGRSYGKIIECTVDNVKLTATPDNLTGEYDNGDKVGGIVGACWNSTLTNNKANNVTIQGYRDLGGIAGYAAQDDKATTITGSVVTELDIIIDSSHNYKNYTTEDEHDAGAIVGELGTGATANESENNSSNVEVIYGETTGVTLPVTNADEFKAAITAGVKEITVAGEIDLTKVSLAGNLTLVGVSDEAVLDGTSAANYIDCSGNLNFKNLTIKLNGNPTAHYNVGLENSGGTHVYENCKFEGCITAWGNSTYTECEFTNTTKGKYAAWVYVGTVVYNKCTFTGNDRAVKVFNENAESGLNVTYNKCTFKATTSNKTAVEVDVTNNINGCTWVSINNATISNMGDAEHYGNKYFNLEHSDKGNGIVVLDDATFAMVKGNHIKTVLEQNTKTIEVGLTGDATTTGQTAAYSAEAITVNGNNHTLTFTDSYRTYIGTAGGKIVLNNVNVVRNTTGSNTHWHNNNMKFNNDVEMTNVTFNKGITIDAVKANMKNVTITKNKVATYGMFIVCGSSVVMDACNINSVEGVKGRGIKITNEDAANKTADTYLKVINSSFDTEEKAAIVALTKGGVVDIELDNVDITNVAEDTEYAVWVDEDAAEYADLVRVTGGKVKIEGQIADGVTLKDNVYSISNANGMFWFANEVNVNKKNFSGKTVKLVADIDLLNQDWEPIGQTGATEFKGVFDGQEYTISNLSVDSEKETGNYYSSALFGWLEGHDSNNPITVKNVNINSAKIIGHHNCAALVGYMEGSVLVQNCHVKKAEVSCTVANSEANGDKAGALIGNGNSEPKLKDCTATDSSVSAGRDAGQVVGAAKTANVTNCSAKNVTVINNETGTGANIRNEIIGRLL